MNKVSIRLLEANYDPVSGVSYAKIGTKLGVFEATSRLSEEDRDIESKFAGCEFAEKKAVIKYFKTKLKEAKSEHKGIQQAYFALSRKNREKIAGLYQKSFTKVNTIKILIKNLEQSLEEEFLSRRSIIYKYRKDHPKGSVE